MPLAKPDIRSLTCAGYPVDELCRYHSFEEVAYLQWHGELPTHEQVAAQNRAERAHRALDRRVASTIAEQPFASRPVDTLRSAIRVLWASDPVADDTAPAAMQAQALRLFAALPAIVAADQRRRLGLGAVPPRDDLSYAANFLYMTFGKVPEPQIVAAFEKSLILYAGQSLNPAVLAGRAPASAKAWWYGTVIAAVDAFSGPSHGGGCESVVRMLNEIAIPDNARSWLDDARASGQTVAGFDQPGAPYGDPRVPTMRAALGITAALRRGEHLIEVYEALATTVFEVDGLHPILDFPAGPAFHLMGFDTEVFAPILAVAGFPGLTASLAGVPSRSLAGQQRNSVPPPRLSSPAR